MNNMVEIENYIKSFLQSINDEDVVFNNDTDLFRDGIFDSYGLVQLVSKLKTDFGIKIPFKEFTLQNFRSVNTILKLINKQQ